MSDAQRFASHQADSWLDKPIPCLDHGFVMLKDYMGGDASIVQAARVSYGDGTKKASDDKALIAYLMRHRHTTPFEMVELKFLVKLPIFVARQMIRHRTASVNELSARYSVMSDEFYLPRMEDVRYQSTANRQGSSTENVSDEVCAKVADTLQAGTERAYSEYEGMIEADIARELARVHLPISLYTQWYWKIDLHNLLHFLELRLNPHAQYEIRVYAEAMVQIIKDVVPWTWEAFEEFRLNARTFSGSEIVALSMLLQNREVELPESIKKGGRRREFEEKLRALGVDPSAVLPKSD
jgi:thymidylate synthase (FAD)